MDICSEQVILRDIDPVFPSILSPDPHLLARNMERMINALIRGMDDIPQRLLAAFVVEGPQAPAEHGAEPVEDRWSWRRWGLIVFRGLGEGVFEFEGGSVENEIWWFDSVENGAVGLRDGVRSYSLQLAMSRPKEDTGVTIPEASHSGC
jgi:hypothetical protein